ADASPPLEPLPVTVPDGFGVHAEGRGFTVYRKDYDPGSPDWVTVVDLRVARLRNIVGDAIDAPWAHVERGAAIDHWDDVSQRTVAGAGRARVLITGTYFAAFDPAPIAFGLQADDSVISYGYGDDEFPGQTKVLGWDDGSAEMSLYDMVTPDRSMFE